MNTNDTLVAIRTIVQKHLPDRTYKVFLFGSRATGSARRFSDFDIGVLGNTALPAGTLSDIQEELENSDIPYKVEVIDFTAVDPSFTKIATRHIQYLV